MITNIIDKVWIDVSKIELIIKNEADAIKPYIVKVGDQMISVTDEACTKLHEELQKYTSTLKAKFESLMGKL